MGRGEEGTFGLLDFLQNKKNAKIMKKNILCWKHYDAFPKMI